MNMEEIMEAFEDLLYDLHHTMPKEGEPLRSVWEATIERVEFAMRKMKEAGEGSGTMRRTKLEKDVQEKVVEAVKQGATFELAALYAGISYSTFNNWMKRGRAESERLEKPRVKPKEKEHVFLQFLEAVKTAEGAAAVEWLKKIEDASKDQWQAAAWKLERRYPKEYGKQIHEHTGADGAAVIRVKLLQGDDDDD